MAKNIVDSDFAERSDLLRFVLILLVVAIHARLQSGMTPDASGGGDIPAFFYKFPHTAVPFFFIMSGFFLTWKLESFEYFKYPTMLRKKFFSLFIPYLLWNTIFFLPHWILPLVFKGSALLPQAKFAHMGIGEAVMRAFGMIPQYYPIDVPLWFVRDLILFFAISPLLLWLIYHIHVLILVPAAIAILFTPFSMNAVGYFMLGMLWGIYKWNFSYLDRVGWICWLSVIVLGVLMPVWFSWPVFVLVSGAAFYVLGGWLKKMSASAQWLNRKLGKTVFWLFCIHAPIATTLVRVYLKIFGKSYSIFDYCIVIVTTIIISLALLMFFKRFFPFLCGLLNGQRGIVPKVVDR